MIEPISTAVVVFTKLIFLKILVPMITLARPITIAPVPLEITNTSEIALATDDLLSQVDCISNLTDNTVVSSLATILDKANAANIPVFGSEIEQVKLGCLAAEGLDYVALGKQTGKMAAKVLKGEKKASEMPFETITEAGLYLNTKVAENLGITVEDDLKNSAVETYDSISEN